MQDVSQMPAQTSRMSCSYKDKEKVHKMNVQISVIFESHCKITTVIFYTKLTLYVYNTRSQFNNRRVLSRHNSQRVFECPHETVCAQDWTVTPFQRYHGLANG
jgi:hypothetical protein